MYDFFWGGGHFVKTIIVLRTPHLFDKAVFFFTMTHFKKQTSLIFYFIDYFYL